jgi:hypothetical protein
LLAGLVVCVPLGYYYRFSRESSPLRGKLDYTRASLGEINRDWDLLQHIQKQNAFLGGHSPAIGLAANVHAALLEAGNEVIEGYRNNSDPRLQDFDWPKAALCFTHLIELDRNDREAQGKLALCHGYENLGHAEHAAESDFEEAAALIPRSPDPHLGLARIFVYSSKNIGKAMAELHEAQRLGFVPGPREIEEQADGYRFRATAELNQAATAGPAIARSAIARSAIGGPAIGQTPIERPLIEQPKPGTCAWRSAISNARANCMSPSKAFPM